MKKKTMVNGWVFIPTSMIFAALGWGVSVNIPAIVLKSLDVSNTLIGLSSLLGLPLAFRFIMGPFMDARGTKRVWTLNTQVVITGAMLLLAALSGLSVVFNWSENAGFIFALMAMFALMSVFSAFQSLSWGGFFLMAVDEREKAFFVGINSSFVRLANIFSRGLMVVVAGKIQQQTGYPMLGWAVCFATFGIIQVVLMIYHRFVYPYPVLDRPLVYEDRKSLRQVVGLFMQQRRAWVILAFIALYRLDEGLLAFMKVPFLMDSPEKGGLGVPLAQIGLMNGTYGAVGMILGGILGGLTIRRYGLRRVIWPFAFLLTLPNAGFIWLAHHPMYDTVSLLGSDMNLWALIAVIVEAFGYGLGFSSFAFFHCEVSRGPHRATFFALVTGLMTVSYIAVGSISGFLQAQIGYFNLFVLSVVASIPGIALIAWLPLKELEEKGKKEDAERHSV